MTIHKRTTNGANSMAIHQFVMSAEATMKTKRTKRTPSKGLITTLLVGAVRETDMEHPQ